MGASSDTRRMVERKEGVMSYIVYCDNCPYRGIDPLGPGAMMICEHPDAIDGGYIHWDTLSRHRVSTICPKITEKEK